MSVNSLKPHWTPPVANSPRTRAIAAMFGLGTHAARPPQIENQKSKIENPPSEISNLKSKLLAPASITLITGTSGAGKSTLLRHIEQTLNPPPPRGGDVTPVPSPATSRLNAIPLPRRRALVDCFTLPLDQTLALLARAGLAEAHLFLRPPAQLSEGQQFRYRLAQWMAKVAPNVASASCRCSPARAHSDQHAPHAMAHAPINARPHTRRHRQHADATAVLLADEFCSTLDRPSARALAWQFARFIRDSAHTEHPRAALLATAHDDLTDDLHPDTLIRMDLGNRMQIITLDKDVI